jgi:hypothetical protein
MRCAIARSTCARDSKDALLDVWNNLDGGVREVKMKPLDSTTEEMMARYLLGAASDSECVEVEDRFLRDAEFLTHLRAIEYDLMDDYLRGEMPKRDRSQFEKQLQSSQVRMDRITRARRVTSKLDRLASDSMLNAAIEPQGAQPAPTGAQTTRIVWGRRIAFWFSQPRLALQYGFAAIAVLLMLGGLWALNDLRASRDNLVKLNAERDSLKKNEIELHRQLAAQQAQQEQQAARMQKELDEQRARGARLQAEMKQLSSRPAFDESFVALALTPGIDRGPSNAPRKLAIPKGIRGVKLQLELGPASNYRTYRAEIATPGGPQVWSQSGLQPTNTEYGRFVTLVIPARALEASEYELTLQGVTAEGKSEVAGYYYFIAAPSADVPR